MRGGESDLIAAKTNQPNQALLNASKNGGARECAGWPNHASSERANSTASCGWRDGHAARAAMRQDQTRAAQVAPILYLPYGVVAPPEQNQAFHRVGGQGRSRFSDVDNPEGYHFCALQVMCGWLLAPRRGLSGRRSRYSPSHKSYRPVHEITQPAQARGSDLNRSALHRQSASGYYYRRWLNGFHGGYRRRFCCFTRLPSQRKPAAPILTAPRSIRNPRLDIIIIDDVSLKPPA
jgi:hypothetical protein